MKDYGYCRIFVRGVLDEAERVVVVALAQENERSFSGIEVEVRRSDEWAQASSDDFLRWPVHIEVDNDVPESGEVVVPLVIRLLAGLRAADLPAVAACDFEDELTGLA